MNNLQAKIEYYLNVVYYGMYSFSVNYGILLQNALNRLCIYIICALCRGVTKTKYLRNAINSRKEIKIIFFDYENGIHKQSIERIFRRIVMSYAILPAGILMAFYEKIKYNTFWDPIYPYFLFISTLLIVFLLNYIVDKFVFSKQQYIRYAMIFEAKDDNWHTKSALFAFVFLLGFIAVLFCTFFVMSVIIETKF